MAVLGGSVVVGPGGGRCWCMRMGLITRRIRFTDVTAVLVDQAKVSVARANGGEVSLYAWRKGRLDACSGCRSWPATSGTRSPVRWPWLRLPSDSPPGADAARPAGPGRAPPRDRSRLATALLGGAGVLAIVGALVVRVHWDNPVLTVLSVIIALALGVSGLLYLLVALWILLTGRAPRTSVPL